MLFVRKALVTASVAISAVASAFVAASPASASVWTDSSSSTSCDSQCLVLFYNTGYAGSYTRFSSTGSGSEGIRDLAAYTFLGSGSGQGMSLKNHAASAKARIWSVDSSVTIYYNSGYAGPCDKLHTNERPAAYQLSKTYNNNASVLFRSAKVSQGCVNFS
ncbi:MULTISPECIES: hypothetical protein [unclassified Streptomyces]|uniref:hypothetical protein n=1 Tax=unclassified Streptomyces TaxID=2593676 RepID=UPI0035D91B56